jgi:hypothetical protein
MAVQSVITLHDVPIATAVMLFFTQVGSTSFLTLGQTIFLRILLLEINQLNPTVTTTDLIRAGAVGLKLLVTEAEVPALLMMYEKSLHWIFYVALAMVGVAAIFSCGVEWKKLKHKEITAAEVVEVKE